ncbi:aromatic ring-hydroxylating dioxygenase subunit alpha [Roseomonas sp. KE2513]|uniref:aromatic ring-hydroxylating oxygenase subunit alpha n=1 Tax=Roseomonas sp. KE2513 TaxID=2479202 RepID=UPI0018DF9416|nr:aromatic ring-hydroxylating dioxygenase subunit alpha [Roseomonas sp. KE2513]MBI0538911.1 aromatic ring-hydroxylating dioxygenase subunit alpha [Roseomonas sp. KE2513]
MSDAASNQWVDSQRGFISRDIFVDPKVYQLELEKLFTRAWLFVGHESQIPNPGDFFTSRMGEESVILCRDKKGEVHVFLNSCRHRGMKVCRYEQGNTSLFTCPYHSWTYATDGKLQGVPLYKSLYDGVLDRSEHSLIEVPRLVKYKGTVWASWDAQAPDFFTYLGDAKQHIDQALDCRDGREGGSEVIGVHKWIIPANWKLAAENFLGDTYHNPSHRSVDLIGIGPSAAAGVKGRRDDELAKAKHIWVSFMQGHGVHSAIAPEGNEYVNSFLSDPEIEEYFRHCFEERKRRLGEQARLLPFTGTIFPNTSYHGRQPRGLCSWHPHSPTETEAWRFFLVDADAPAQVKEYLRHYYMRYSGPAGMTEQDDMENWLYATRASMGTIARRYPFNYQQSMNTSKMNDLVPGNVSTQMTEEMARGYYRAWSRYLNDSDWDIILGRDGVQHAAAAE